MVVDIQNGDDKKDLIDLQNCIHIYLNDDEIQFVYYRQEENMVITLADEDDAVIVQSLIRKEIQNQMAKGGMKCNAYLKIYKNGSDYSSLVSF